MATQRVVWVRLQLPQCLALGFLLRLHLRRHRVRSRGTVVCRHRRRLRYFRHCGMNFQVPLRQGNVLTVAEELAAQHDLSYQSEPLQPLGLQQSLPDSTLGIAESVDFDEVFHEIMYSLHRAPFFSDGAIFSRAATCVL